MSNATMTRKDFELIARTLREVRERSGVGAKVSVTWGYAMNQVAYEFAHALRLTNPRFDTDKFLETAGVAPVDRS